MIIYAITILICSLVFICISISLYKGNTSLVHGKAFDETKDKVGFTKKLGTPLLVCGIMWLISVPIVFFSFIISYTLFIGSAVYLVIHMLVIEQKEMKKIKEENKKME